MRVDQVGIVKESDSKEAKCVNIPLLNLAVKNSLIQRRCSYCKKKTLMDHDTWEDMYRCTKCNCFFFLNQKNSK